MSKKPFIFLGIFLSYFLFLLLTGHVSSIHAVVFAAFFLFYFLHKKTRLLLLLTLPFLLKNLIYDAFRWVPFDFLKPIHLEGPYQLEKLLFGVRTGEGVLLLTQYLASFKNSFLDFYTGLFYILPELIPLAVVFLLWHKRGRETAWHYSLAFLLMNLFAFLTYLFYPVAPPWYVEQFGFTQPAGPVIGNAAGLSGFERLFASQFVSDTYALNPVVFGAIPSMHVGYAFFASFFLWEFLPKSCRGFLFIYLFSVCFGSLYLGHHYMIDVLLGIAYAGAAILALKWMVRQATFLLRWVEPIFVSSLPILLGKPLPSISFPVLIKNQESEQEEEGY